MIFYFTGTGNSLYAAKKLADDGEEVISIIDALRCKAFHYVLKENEKLGFVFPVYFYTVSDPVLEFVRNLQVENAGFVYAVIPCGASIGPAGGFLKQELKQRGLGKDESNAGRGDPGTYHDQASNRPAHRQQDHRKRRRRKSKSDCLSCLHEHKKVLRGSHLHPLRKVRGKLSQRRYQHDRRPPGMDEKQMSQMLRLHQPLSSFRHSVRRQDRIPQSLCEPGFEVRIEVLP